jgi:hypothetical protein
MRDEQTTWQHDDPRRLVTWTPAQPPRAVEGPFDLACFEGQVLVLELGPDMLACRELGGALQQVFLDGLHKLEIGDGAGLIPPASRLYMLRPSLPISWRWRQGDELVIDTGTARGERLPLRGTCSLFLDDPMRFYREVLAGLDQLEASDLVAVLDALVRSQIAAHLLPLGQAGRFDRMRAQIQLGELDAEHLSEDLTDLGLGCRHLAAFTPQELPEPAPPELVGGPLAGSYDDVL